MNGVDIKRFWARVRKTKGCWHWMGSKQKGYGAMSVGGVLQRAHHISYTIKHGTIPDGMSICHKCDDPSCVRPSHLFMATHRENMLDCARKKRFKNANAQKTHCKHGHHLTGENVCLRWRETRKKW